MTCIYFLFDSVRQTCEFSLLRPKIEYSQITWSASIRLRDTGRTSLLLVTNNQQKSMTLSNPRIMYNGSVLKSALQKAIRRKLTETAMRIACQYMLQDMENFLRRLAVIVLEDVVLHPDYAVLIWFMAAHSKGFQLTRQILLVVLKMVFSLAVFPFRDVVLKVDYTIEVNVSKALNLKDMLSHSNVAAIMVRVAFGGMPGDKMFMVTHAHTWHERLKQEEKQTEFLQQPWHNMLQLYRKVCYAMSSDEEMKWIEPCATNDGSANIVSEPWLRKEDMLDEAVDFHCVPQCLPLIASRTKLSSESIRKAMWFHRSGINRKQLCCHETDPLACFDMTKTSLWPMETSQEMEGRKETLVEWRRIHPTLGFLRQFWKPIVAEQDNAKRQPIKKRKRPLHQPLILKYLM